MHLKAVWRCGRRFATPILNLDHCSPRSFRFRWNHHALLVTFLIHLFWVHGGHAWVFQQPFGFANFSTPKPVDNTDGSAAKDAQVSGIQGRLASAARSIANRMIKGSFQRRDFRVQCTFETSEISRNLSIGTIVCAGNCENVKERIRKGGNTLLDPDHPMQELDLGEKCFFAPEGALEAQGFRKASKPGGILEKVSTSETTPRLPYLDIDDEDANEADVTIVMALANFETWVNNTLGNLSHSKSTVGKEKPKLGVSPAEAASNQHATHYTPREDERGQALERFIRETFPHTKSKVSIDGCRVNMADDEDWYAAHYLDDSIAANEGQIGLDVLSMRVAKMAYTRCQLITNVTNIVAPKMQDHCHRVIPHFVRKSIYVRVRKQIVKLSFTAP